MRKRSLQSLALALGALLLLLTSSAVRAGGEVSKYNVLFIICDVGSYEYPRVQTPNIDRLAQRGRLFERAYCQWPVCGPSRASFMSGLYPGQALVGNNRHFRDALPEIQTMAQLFKNAGSRSVRIGKVFHYNVPVAIGTDGHDDPLSWDERFNPRGTDRTKDDDIVHLDRGEYKTILSWKASDDTDGDQTDGKAAEKAIEYLESFARDRAPFFLAVGFFRPHRPFVAPNSWFDLYPKDEIAVPEVSSGYFETLPDPARKSLSQFKAGKAIPADTAQTIIQAYHASVSFMDAQVGRVLDALDESGLAGKTVVIFTSDHGFHLGEHGHYSKETLFKESARVPLIISVPGMQAAGEPTTSLAELIDLYPTLSELCGLPGPAHLAGKSLVPALNDPAATVRESALTQNHQGASIRTSRYRYTVYGKNGDNGVELYDHETDPMEMTNLARQQPYREVKEALAREFRLRTEAATGTPEGVKYVRK